MKNLLFVSLLFLLLTSCEKTIKKEDSIKKEIVKIEPEKKVVPNNIKLNKEQQIASALLAAPTEARADAKVYGYDENGDFVTLREGTNNFICIADNPKNKGFQVVCYHASLEPMMARGRELAAEGKSRGEKEKIRAAEAKSGKLKLPKNPAALHILYGEKGFFDIKTNKAENVKYRYVIYIPYATQQSTGLNLKPNASSHPWLMFPGQYNAHIMITP